MINKNRNMSFGGTLWCVLAIILAVAVTAFLKYPRCEVNYTNSDATYHTLLTLTAYDETPAYVHKFLPIVSLGEESDKWFPWGSTVPDENGNYYYTSFSAMGYFAPYFFIKIFGLPTTTLSLYIFNTTLLALSCVIIFLLFREILQEQFRYRLFLPVVLLYILSVEIMHSMGLSYWVHSLMQVLIPLQCLLYYRYITCGCRSAFFGFLLFCLLNPYTEWSGFVGNFGFFLSELYLHRKERTFVRRLGTAACIAIITIASGVLFCLHFCMVIDPTAFIMALKERFFARNITASTRWSKLFLGYWDSFGLMIVLAGCSVLSCLVFCRQKTAITEKQWIGFFVAAFPLLENVVMKQHAISYTFDRMKLALPLMMVIYWCISQMISEKRSCLTGWLLTGMAICGAMSYRLRENYVWKTYYQSGNSQLCAYINEHYNDSICGYNLSVRGYLNTLLGRACYEWVQDPARLEKKAEEFNFRYIVLLEDSPLGDQDISDVARENPCWSIEKYNATVYDRLTGEMVRIDNLGTSIQVYALEE